MYTYRLRKGRAARACVDGRTHTVELSQPCNGFGAQRDT